MAEVAFGLLGLLALVSWGLRAVLRHMRAEEASGRPDYDRTPCDMLDEYLEGEDD